MKAYKGFTKDMKCRDFQYEVGKTYEEPEAELCRKGFHACEAPIDCLRYYDPAHSVYHEVELDATEEREEGDTKRVGKKIKIGAQLDIPHLCKVQFEYVKSHCTNENNADPGKPATAGYRGAATAGNYGAATAGNYGAATAGESGAATAGESGAATAGYRGAATAGESGAATAGYRGAATAGNYGAATAGNYGAATAGESGAATAGYRGAATAGNYGAATAGNYGAATSRGRSAVGENGIACARGNHVRVKGGMGAVLVIAEENESDYDIAHWNAFVIDGKQYKADTWYTFKDGELVEVSDEDEQ
ncbi:MAG: hypothetical protein IJ523_08080 [Succinivibrionaceae bacterium]|nr:hypothetical protein [Succinivibrionaceae bacterium]